MRRRLDAELVRRGLATGRSQAVRLIESGLVLVGGAPADKAARLVDPAEAVTLTGPPPRYVGRGGDKLEAGLAGFAVAVAGRDALDAGSSTGGFTDCLLQAGARRVVAVDVGRGQLHQRLRADPRVEVRERTDIRVFASQTSERFGLIVADLSFISLRTVAAPLAGLAAPGADMVVLIKPQFEAGRAEASRGRGVIRDPAVWRRALVDAINAFGAVGAANMGVMVSPLRGADGNVEFLAHFTVVGDDGPIPFTPGSATVDQALAAAADLTGPGGS
ncbi:MAG TPA: TlyA family RNA methyltransferase [Acidimicrobiales bacterium]|nr:TlyA family RNA methyltransferase [Acidimicrobiales bacterium]